MLLRSCVHSGLSETLSTAFYSDSSSSSFSLPEHHSYALSARGDGQTKQTAGRRITVKEWKELGTDGQGRTENEE